MQEIAADLGYSETIFIDSHSSLVPSVRIFTPLVELEFAGHPLVGCAWVLGSSSPNPVDRVRCRSGEVRCWADQTSASITVVPSSDVTRIDGAGLAANTGLPVPERSWIARIPQPYTLLDLKLPESVTGAVPNFELLAGFDPVYLFARERNWVRARFFAPAFGVAEDPATGSAAVALASVLAHEGEEKGSVAISQGTEIGVPCRIELAWTADEVRIGGTVVCVGQRTLDW